MVNYPDIAIPVYLLLESYLLIFTRLLGFFIVVPIFGGNSTPSVAKIGIATFTAGIVLTGRNISLNTTIPTLLEFSGVIIKELCIGLILGFIVYAFFAMFYFVGQLIDYQIGFSMVSVYDPLSQIQVPITGNLLFMLVCMLLVITNGHQNLFRALFFSFEALPLGEAVLSSTNMLGNFLQVITVFFVTGFQTTLPITSALLAIQLALGLLTKTAPQMNIFSIGMIIKLIGGLLILYFILPLFTHISDVVFTQINRSLLQMIEGLMPR